jgi:hypothetical protein
MDLIFNTSGYYSREMPNSVASVDVIQIYIVEDKKTNHVLPLKILRRQRLVGEVRKKEDIADFFESFQNIASPGIERCSRNKAGQVFHIVAFDATLMRVAYFRYYLCSINEAKYGIIRSLGDEGLFDNTTPPALLIKRKE